ncbi:type IV pilus assembly protein PilM [soil metagenome]
MGSIVKMNNTLNNSYFYTDKPVFGLDIGFSSLKVMQIDSGKKHSYVTGYGVTNFEPGSVEDGIIVNPEALAKAAYEMFNKNLIGAITTRRVVMAIPASRTFTRTMSLPKMKSKDIDEAVRSEAEQYIPMPLESLYLDSTVISNRDKDNMELLVVAAPKKIVDSYLTLARLLGLEVAAIETTISAAGRLFAQAEASDLPTVLVDLGSLSTDITVYDNGPIITGTVPGGGDSISDLVSEKLGVTKQEAHIIKTKYGLGVSKKQAQLTEALRPQLDQLIKEVKRMLRYHEERSGSQKKIGQVVTMGGGASMPGLSEYMTSSLRMPVRMCDPWQNLDFKRLQLPNNTEKAMFVTVAGLGLVKTKEAYA